MATLRMREALRDAMAEEMRRDEAVLVMGEDVGVFQGAFKVTEGLLDRFGAERVLDTPISETGFVGAAAGAAHMGMRPVCEMQFIDFVSCAYSILTNYVATARYRAMLPCPMVVRGPSGGYVRGGPFHSQNPEAAFLHTPGLKIVYPATASDAKGLIKSAIRDDDCVLFFEHKYLYRRAKEELPQGDHVVPIGKARLAREGRDLSIVTYAATVWKALEAAEQLEREDGLSVEVLDLRTLLPMDDEAIVATVKKTNRVLVVHEDTVTGGIAGEITARINELAFEWLDAPVRRVAAHDVPLPYAPQLEDFVLPQTADIVRAARWLAAY
jgi:2-oxoisovalerate dehydrogenase E1 component beta subunit